MKAISLEKFDCERNNVFKKIDTSVVWSTNHLNHFFSLLFFKVEKQSSKVDIQMQYKRFLFNIFSQKKTKK